MKGVRPVAWFDSATPLRSGWAYGQGYLKGGVVVVDASVGKGKLLLFGPEITFRAQPHGTFKFLFNGIYLSARTATATTGTASAASRFGSGSKRPEPESPSLFCDYRRRADFFDFFLLAAFRPLATAAFALTAARGAPLRLASPLDDPLCCPRFPRGLLGDAFRSS